MTETLEREWTHEGRPELKRAPHGPWNDEPDKRHWIDTDSGLDCLMVRNQMGAWCGYVGVTEGHPYFGVCYSQCVKGCEADCYEYDHSPCEAISVHGGLTYADFCREAKEGEAFGICHTPLNGRPERVWWLGFDCAHAYDLVPTMIPYGLMRDDIYRDVEYVKGECASLAQQLKAVAA